LGSILANTKGADELAGLAAVYIPVFRGENTKADEKGVFVIP